MIFILLWLLNGYLLLEYNYDGRGQFGDMFGASNSLFSGLALAAVAYSLWLQRKELELQRKITLLSVIELQESTKAQQGSENALRNQTLALDKQVEAINKQLLALNRQLNIQTITSQITAYGHLFNDFVLDLQGTNYGTEERRLSLNKVESINKKLNDLLREIEIT